MAVVDNTCDSAIRLGASTKQGAWAEFTAKRKVDHYQPILSRRSPQCVIKPAVVETHGFIHDSLRSLLKSLAYHSTKQAVAGLDEMVSSKQFRLLYGLELNSLYQEFAVAVVNAVIGTIESAAEKVIQDSPQSRRSTDNHLSLLGRNKLARRLETAHKTMCAYWE